MMHMTRKLVLFIIMALGISTIAVTFNIQPVKATWVEGHITQDTTWKIQDSPFVLISDVVVDSNATLTIEPGVEVKFGGDFSLVVEGSLLAVGTEAAKIKFTSNKLSPKNGDWDMVQFVGNESKFFRLEQSIIEYAKTGIKHSGDGDISVRNSIIRNNSATGIELWKGDIEIQMSTLELNSRGIASFYGITLSNITILQNSILKNSQGIYFNQVDLFNITILKNSIYSNTDCGIFLDRCHKITNLLICENNVHDNDGPGIKAILPWAEPARALINVSIKKNCINSNARISNYDGIYFDVDGRVTNFEIIENSILSNNGNGILVFYRIGRGDSTSLMITNNWIESNTRNGISIDADDDPALTYEAYITNNSITNNERGIRYSGYSKGYSTRARVYVKHNSISNNTVGVELYEATNSLVQYNDIYGNQQGMFIGSGISVNAENNFWGHPTGPYHESFNPMGQGNPVNGDGTDLDFIQFLTQEVNPIIPEFSSFFILPLFMIATLLVATVFGRRRINTR